MWREMTNGEWESTSQLNERVTMTCAVHEDKRADVRVCVCPQRLPLLVVGL